ncbi:MAG: hypothetical protein K2X77_03700 [Candidatus Obscuribacterales bacterium]|nr:hypothetical protein [Candidatus Obscuribacterales bacterium]
MIEDEELGLYQEALIKAALDGDDASSLQQILLANEALTAQHAWIQSWEPRMGDLARLLTRKWAVEAE